MASSGGQWPAPLSGGISASTSTIPPSVAALIATGNTTMIAMESMGYVSDGSGGPTGSLATGVLGMTSGTTADKLRTPKVFTNLSAVVVTSETTIWTPTTGKKFRLMGFCLTQGVATGAVTLKDNTAGTTILIIPATPVGTPLVVAFGNGILSAAANNVLTATGASTETLTGFLFGTEE